jgi:membrane protease YdiL (CAAX protease family)
MNLLRQAPEQSTATRPRLIAFASFFLFAVVASALLFGLTQLLARLPFAGPIVRLAGRGIIDWRYIWLVDSACLLITILLSLAAARLEHVSIRLYGLAFTGRWVKMFGKGILLGLVLAFADIALTWLLGGFSFGSIALAPFAIPRYALLWAIGFLLVGLFEEYLFRGYPLYALIRAIGFWPAAALLAVLFAALHLGNPGEGFYGAIDVAVYALFASLTLLRTGSLWFAVGLHAAWDFSLTFLYGVSTSGVSAQNVLFHSRLHGPTWMTGGSVGPEGSAIGIGVLLVAFLASAKWMRATPQADR